MAQLNITISEELLKGLFLSDGKDEAFKKLLEQIFNDIEMVTLQLICLTDTNVANKH